GLRSYNRELLESVFEVLGHKKENIQSNFGHMLDAFDYGVPPHGGIALGFDRFISILLDEDSIREVIAFPKAGNARDLMMDAPSKTDDQQLKELNLKIIKDEK
ncbi:MAG: aspartate--tRNA ligase, partial [Candidatus Pacebacteria bacterium]|nr:aspartate--tRNA ligase [Candidatus Paceibacterota bacterium]